MYADLRQFARALEEAGELRRVSAPVSPTLQIAEIADRVSKMAAAGAADAAGAVDPRWYPSNAAQATDPRFWDRGGRALLFENVEGSDFPVLINAFGSYRRMEMALGCHRFSQAEVDALVKEAREKGDRLSLTPDPGRIRGHSAGGLEGLAERMAWLVKPEPPRSIGEAVAKARQFAPLLKIGPRRVKRAACQEIVKTGDEVDLTRLPMLRCWPLDGDLAAVGYPADVNAGVEGQGHPEISDDEWERSYRGRYITLAGVHTIHADDRNAAKPRSHNIGMYRMQLLGKKRLAMHWHMHHDGAAHWRSWKAIGEPMPVAICFGGESVLPYAATCPLPPGISELLMAGFLAGRGIRLVRARSVPLWVPANSEIVIEGFVSTEAGIPGWDPRDDEAGDLGPGAAFEGPFGDHTGFYSMPDRYPLLDVTAVTHRADAIFPATIVGLPPQEDYFLGKATERIMLPLLQTLIPDIHDYDLPLFGAFHNCAILKIRKEYPLHGRRVMSAVWGAGQMAWTKVLFVVDDDCDPHDHWAALRRCAELCRPGRDTFQVRGPLDILDHAAPWLGAGGKIGFDCTRKIEGEQVRGTAAIDAAAWQRPSAERIEALLNAVRGAEGVVDVRAPEELGGWLLVSTSRRGEGPINELLAALEAAGAAMLPFTVILGEDVDLGDLDLALFHWVAGSDMARDVIPLSGAGRSALAFDATPKDGGAGASRPMRGMPVRPWPPIIAMDDATKRAVDGMWGSLGLE